MTAVADPDLQIRGPRSSRPRHKGWGGGAVSKKNYRLFWPQFGLKIRGRAPRAPPLDPPLDWNAPAGQLWQMETTPGLTHNAAGPKGACPRDSWPFVFLFSSQAKRKPAGIMIYKTSYILIIIPSVATYATHRVTCLFYKNSECQLDPLPNFVYNAPKFSFLSLQAQMVSKVSWSIIARITKSLRFYIGDGVGKGLRNRALFFLPMVGRGIIGDL